MSSFKKLSHITNDVGKQKKICMLWVQEILETPSSCESLCDFFESGENLVKLIERVVEGQSQPGKYPKSVIKKIIRYKEIRRISVDFAKSRGVNIFQEDANGFINDLNEFSLLNILEEIAKKGKVDLSKYHKNEEENGQNKEQQIFSVIQNIYLVRNLLDGGVNVNIKDDN